LKRKSVNGVCSPRRCWRRMARAFIVYVIRDRAEAKAFVLSEEVSIPDCRPRHG
jgi:hypothetical protein